MDMISLIKEPITSELEAYKEHFTKVLSHEDKLLGSALQLVRSRSGKMMRPMLVLLIAKALGRVNESVLHVAVTLELLHTASLVHDDVVDESKLRRGQSSVNAFFGNKAAVLVGDYLLSLALEESSLTEDIDIVNAISNLGKTLSQGELFQLDNVQSDTFSEEAYYRIIREKTAILFEACATLGLCAGDGDAVWVTTVEKLGLIMGQCFQVRDDVFDYFSDDIGKPTGNDMLEGKLTLPVLHALNHTDNKAMQALALKVKAGTADLGEITQLVSFTKENGGIDYAEEVMEGWCSKGHSLIDSLPQSEASKALHYYLDFVKGRRL